MTLSILPAKIRVRVETSVPGDVSVEILDGDSIVASITGWQLTRALRSWLYPGCEGAQTDIEVYARAALVELFINGKSVGKKKPKKARANFRATYENGEICAVSYNAAGEEIGRVPL